MSLLENYIFKQKFISASGLFLSVLATTLFFAAELNAQEWDQDTAPEAVEIVVTGRQPGPPLWQVNNGDNVLWILPTVTTVPKGMIWEDDELSEIIQSAQEYIKTPGVQVTVSKLVMLNPINWVRAPGLIKKMSRLEDDQTLEDVLPQELYQRYVAMKEVYLPRDKKLDSTRPSIAISQISSAILKEEDLKGADEIIKHVERLVRRNRNIEKTDVEMKYKLDGGFGDIRDRMLAMVENLNIEDEINCFEDQLRLYEDELNEMKYVANAWASGDINDIVDVLGDNVGSCETLMLESSEKETYEEIRSGMRESWLSAVVAALDKNAVTFTILPIWSLQSENGLLQELIDRGYQVKIPR